MRAEKGKKLTGKRQFHSKAAALLLILNLVACGGSSDEPGQGDGSSGTISQAPGTSCAEPMPAEVRHERITTDVPQDFDPTANPAPNTSFTFTVLLPRRCPDERFPLIVYGHGFGNSRIMEIGNDEDQVDDDNAKPVLDRGYVEISLDQRGHGENRPGNEGGYMRLLDPNAETQDAIAILDWAYDHADEIQVQKEPRTGIPRDLKVGTLGGSYGGAFQLLLAALDPRIDVIAADRTWHNAEYGLMPGDVIKGWMRLLGFLVQLDTLSEGMGVTPTPAVETLVSQVGPFAPNANAVRTRADLEAAIASPAAQPRPVSAEELKSLVITRGMDYFEAQQAAGEAWGFGEAEARLRPVPALFTQGQRDVLFNVTEAFWNARYFQASGAPVSLLTHESGHMHPFDRQVRGPWACGANDIQAAILDWLDFHLKGIKSAGYQGIPRLCLSVGESLDQNAPPVGVELASMPIGSLIGKGSVPASVDNLAVSVTAQTDTNGVFVPVVQIEGDGRVLAGIPHIESLTVSPGAGSLQTAIALVGIGIRRDGQTILVDQQVTAFVSGVHDNNRNVQHDEGVLLPGVGEQLLDGDEVGLLFFQHHVQYAPVASALNLSELDGTGGYLPGDPDIPDSLRPLYPVSGLLAPPNPYEVEISKLGIPILVPGEYPGSELTQ